VGCFVRVMVPNSKLASGCLDSWCSPETRFLERQNPKPWEGRGLREWETGPRLVVIHPAVPKPTQWPCPRPSREAGLGRGRWHNSYRLLAPVILGSFIHGSINGFFKAGSGSPPNRALRGNNPSPGKWEETQLCEMPPARPG